MFVVEDVYVAVLSRFVEDRTCGVDMRWKLEGRCARFRCIFCAFFDSLSSPAVHEGSYKMFYSCSEGTFLDFRM